MGLSMSTYIDYAHMIMHTHFHGACLVYTAYVLCYFISLYNLLCKLANISDKQFPSLVIICEHFSQVYALHHKCQYVIDTILNCVGSLTSHYVRPLLICLV